MSICPHCHQMDKNFFAPQCHNCNEHVGFFQQCSASIVYTTVNILGIIFFVWLIIKMVGLVFSS
jgi:uncharacterized protein (DUF983 family)